MEAPRYEVIADYPKSPFALGDILQLEKTVFLKDWVYLIFSEESKDWLTESEFNNYPHLFKKL